jgi:ABC-type glycerol-3-phosphate transport system substrate-binding protein
MKGNKLSRRDFLRMSGLTAAGAALAACGGPTTPEPAAEAEAEATTPPEPTEVPVAQEVTIDVVAWQPEYMEGERQIWDLFEEEHPNIKINIYGINEEEEAAFLAKVAGGYNLAIARAAMFGYTEVAELRDNVIDLTTIEGLPWDKYTYDPIGLFEGLYGYAPRTLDPFQGTIWTWMYHADLMEEAGLDPRSDVKTWDDLKAWLEAGTKWADANDDVDYFWDLSGMGWMWGEVFPQRLSLAWPEGQIERQNACYLGEAKFNAPDSPYAPLLEFLVEAFQAGWIPKDTLSREWETDMEASYAAKKSVVMYHGPWPWDKALSADPTVVQSGFPGTPPAEGQKTWMEFMPPPSLTAGLAMLNSAKDVPEFEALKTAFVWYHQPDVIAMRAQVYGVPPMVELDEPFDLQGPQFLGVIRDIGVPGGLWEDVQFTTGPYGWDMVRPKFIEGSPNVWAQGSGGVMIDRVKALLNQEMPIQEYLDLAQEGFDESYDL